MLSPKTKQKALVPKCMLSKMLLCDQCCYPKEKMSPPHHPLCVSVCVFLLPCIYLSDCDFLSTHLPPPPKSSARIRESPSKSAPPPIRPPWPWPPPGHTSTATCVPCAPLWFTNKRISTLCLVCGFPILCRRYPWTATISLSHSTKKKASAKRTPAIAPQGRPQDERRFARSAQHRPAGGRRQRHRRVVVLCVDGGRKLCEMSRGTGQDHKSGGAVSSVSPPSVQAVSRVFHAHHGLGVLCVPQADVSWFFMFGVRCSSRFIVCVIWSWNWVMEMFWIASNYDYRFERITLPKIKHPTEVGFERPTNGTMIRLHK